MTASANHLFDIARLADEEAPSLAPPLMESVPDPIESLGLLAVKADDASTTRLGLRLLWWELTHGLCRIEGGFFTESRCLLVTAAVDGRVEPLQGKRLEILETILSGVGQKSIAIELDLAPSTIALNARLALACLGVHCRPSRVHPLLMLTATASRAESPYMLGCSSCVCFRGRQLRVISIPRPDCALHDRLPPAELAVVRNLVEGVSYDQIARTRGTSMRTIANQVTAVFRRMNVSGRSQLLHRLFADESFLAASAGDRAMLTAPPANRVWE